MNTAIQSKLLKLVRANAKVEGISDEKLLSAAYLDEGLVDSFQLVELIATLEKNFSMKFSAAELTSPQFRTLAGVASIIEANTK